MNVGQISWIGSCMLALCSTSVMWELAPTGVGLIQRLSTRIHSCHKRPIFWCAAISAKADLWGQVDPVRFASKSKWLSPYCAILNVTQKGTPPGNAKQKLIQSSIAMINFLSYYIWGMNFRANSLQCHTGVCTNSSRIWQSGEAFIALLTAALGGFLERFCHRDCRTTSIGSRKFYRWLHVSFPGCWLFWLGER